MVGLLAGADTLDAAKASQGAADRGGEHYLYAVPPHPAMAGNPLHQARLLLGTWSDSTTEEPDGNVSGRSGEY